MRPPRPRQVVLSTMVFVVAVPFVVLVIVGGEFESAWDVLFNGFFVVVVILASAGVLYMINRPTPDRLKEQ